MNTKIAIAIFGVALVAVALLGVTTAQFSGAENLSQTAPAYSQTGTNCINATTGELICLNNGTCTNTYCNATCTEANCNNTCTNKSVTRHAQATATTTQTPAPTKTRTETVTDTTTVASHSKTKTRTHTAAAPVLRAKTVVMDEAATHKRDG
jgi:hypothetical protein